MIEWLMGISILLFLESSTVAKSSSSMNTSACVTYQLSMLTPGGGGSAGKWWGFDQGANILVNFLRVGQHTFIKCG